ncbi:putative barnase/colicin E5 family endoribonuclease, partial [Helicobacter felis]|uniref:putative barnase/colicin E5 family endoribonuclease n=1 Tax=Helicobacter felis TaxID=214 RepID=UPI000CF1221C
FVTMWKSKGDIATPRTPSSMGYDLDRTLSRGYQDDPTTPPLKNIEPNPAFGENFSEFEGKGAQAVAKLLKEKHGQVAGAFYREDLGHIDLVWGDSKKGLAHILERRTQQYGEQKALDFINDLPRILQEAKFYKELENKIELVTPTDMIVLGKTDNNKFVLTGFRDRRSKQRFTELENPQTRDDVGFTGKSVSEPQTKDDVLLPNQDNNTTPPLKKPSIREQALAFRQEQKRREQEALEAKEAKYKAERQEQEQAYQASLAQKESQAGTKENQKDLKLGTPIAMQRLQGRSSSVSLDDEHIYPLDFVVVKTQDVKPSFNTGVGTQTRTQTNSKMVEQIAQNFKPEMVLNRGGFDDLPLILSDGQVIAGNHRAKGMQNFTPQSRHTYEQAILEHYGLELKGDELLMRTPKNELDTQEIINLASASNKERAHTYGDKLIAALGKYDSKITPDNLENYLKQSHDVQELAQNVGRALDTQAKEPDIEGANLALLAQSARNTQDYTLSKALNDAQKTLDIEDFSKLKEMLVKNAGSFYTLLRDSRLPNLHLAPYLTQSIPSMAHALKTTRQENFTKLYEDLSALLKTTDEHGINALVKMNPGVYDAMASELLGASLARFVRLENPAQSFYEFLKNAPEGLNALVADTLLKRIEGIPSKPLNESNVYDFITLAIESGENTQIVSKVKDLLPEFEKKARGAKAFLKGEGELIEPNPAFGENFSEFEGKGAQVLLDGRGRADLLDPKKLSKVEQESGEVKPSAVIQSPEEKEAFIKSLDLRTSATPIPASLDVEGFLKSLKEVKNHKRFIEHLASREDKQRRLGFLNLVEPTLNHPDFVMLNNDVGRKKLPRFFKKTMGNI